jgi:hypothetical protein
MIDKIKFTSGKEVQFYRNGQFEDVICPETGLTIVCKCNCMRSPNPDIEDGRAYFNFQCNGNGIFIDVAVNDFIDERSQE